MDLLQGLNEAQKEAVLYREGPLLVLAGAGAGKTRVISHRVVQLIKQGIEPNRILAITFTNKAAEEMKERINKLLRVMSHELHIAPFVSTFHSLCVFILRKSGKDMNVPKNFSILDSEDSLSIIKSSMKELNINVRQFQPSRVQSIISRYKGDLITMEEFRSTLGEDFFPKTIGLIWGRYEDHLKRNQALDFDDLILKTVMLFQKNENIRKHYQNFWQYILIDEYQDTNRAQYELSKILAAGHKNICAIGDIDQAIYGWRGADFRNIINFEKDFPEHRTILFEENYRSTQNILEAAARVIEKNKLRKPKGLFSKKEKGRTLSFFEAMTEEEEAEFIVHKSKELLKKIEPSEIAILYRANFQSRIIEEKFLQHGIPYQVLGIQFYERKEVKDIFAFLKAALNPKDLLSIKRIINIPPRGLGKATILNYFASKKIPKEAEEKLNSFLKILGGIKEKAEKSKPSELIRYTLKESGYQKELEKGNDENRERLENLKELVTIASRYDHFRPLEGIEKMLADAALMSEQDALIKKQEAVKLMTVHAAKGLEFKIVFIIGLEEGLFPHSGHGDNIADKNEEERRLFYVALTRAKEKIFLSFSVSRTIFGARQLNLPSKFLSDIPDHLLEIEKFPKKEEIIEYL
ncbi:MAG: UvrD-helicase domain-containing protein [Patescibacteria group bacterium]